MYFTLEMYGNRAINVCLKDSVCLNAQIFDKCLMNVEFDDEY